MQQLIGSYIHARSCKMQLPTRQLFVVLAFVVIFVTVALYAYSSENVRLKRLPAAEVLSNERMPTTSIHTAVAISAEAIAYEDTRIPTAPLDDLPVNNPGCKSKIIRDYKPRLPGPEYYHPSIVHYVKLYHEDGVKGRLLFREFLAIMSAYKFYRPRIIILHSNADFTSDGYWNDALLWNNVFMRFNSVSKPRKIGNRHVPNLYHAANYLKLEILINYGGIVSDFDVIILNGKQLRKQQRRAECLLSCERDDLTFKYCVKVNSGFYSCIKNSSFLHKWLEIYHLDFRPNDFTYNSGDIPSRILRTDVPSCYNVWTDEDILLPSRGYASRWMLGSVDWTNKPAAHYVAQLLNLPFN